MNLIPRPYHAKISGKTAAFVSFTVQTDATLGKEEYHLTVKDGVAFARCGSERAAFYAQQTLSQLKGADGSVPDSEIHDKPRFPYRSFMLDSARHYQETDEIKKLLDAMALLKMNVFHWHLSEDQGWRIESESHPELNAAAVRAYSDFGRTRCDEPYGIYYTKAQIREIVAYAAARHIDVVPEIDIPGHTSAFLSAVPQASCDGKGCEVKTHQGIFEDVICPAKEEGVAVLREIFDELCELFPFEIYHIGGDEVKHAHWAQCPDCQAKMQALGITSYPDYENRFLGEIADYLAAKGKRCVVWNDAAKGAGLNKENIIVQYWKERDKNTVDYANEGGQVILSPFSYYYLDYDYDITSLRRTVSFRPSLRGMTDAGRENVLGVEAPLWTEYINDSERLEELVFPRLIAVACTAWQQSGFTYRTFLEEAAPFIAKMQEDGYRFRAEEHWGYPHAMAAVGWMRFVKNYYPIRYIPVKYLLGKE